MEFRKKQMEERLSQLTEKLIEFRLHSEGSNNNPVWGIAFRHKRDVKKFIDFTNRPQSIYIQFFNRIYEFGIRPSFWDGCYEFVDAQEKTNAYPIRELFINKLGFNLNNKNCCHILSKVEEFNKKLKIICIYEI